jgi:toxin-antitoxin system PIN domain toxin
VSYLIDTNILVYAADGDSSFHPKALNFLQKCQSSAEIWNISWVNVFEYMRVVTHPSIFKNPVRLEKAMENISAIMGLPQVEVLAEDDNFLESFAEAVRLAGAVSGNLVHDAHIAALMQCHGIRKIYTLDTQFRIFPFLEVIDPLN